MAGSILVQAHAIYEPFDQRETGRLRGYVEDVEELISSRFFGEGTLSLSISIETGGSVTSTLQYPGEEALRAVVGLFRQLYNHHEPTSYHQILKLLSCHVLRDSEHRRAAVGELREFRDAEKEALKPKLALDLREVSPTGDDSKERSYTPAVLIDLFLHGKYLHKGNGEVRPARRLAAGASDPVRLLRRLGEPDRALLRRRQRRAGSAQGARAAGCRAGQAVRTVSPRERRGADNSRRLNLPG